MKQRKSQCLVTLGQSENRLGANEFALVLSSVEKRRPHLWRVNVLLGKEQGGPVTIYGVIVFDQAYQTEKVHFGVVTFSQRLISVDERP